MVYAARSVFLLGTGIMGIGLIWAIAIWKGAIDLMPEIWDQPITALVLCGIGFGISTVGKKMGGDVFGDGDDTPSIDLSRFLPSKKAAKEEVPAGSGRLSAYSDMLEDAPAEIHAPGRPVAKARKPAEVIAPTEKRQLIADLLSGGIKSVQNRVPSEAEGQSASDMSQISVPDVDFHCGRLRLQVAIPQHETDSWIGGGPSMPEGMDWPMIDGKPASFYAQIALSDLPAETWGGLGARQGWLIFFGADDPSARAIVLHSTERGADRSPPEGADYYFQHKSGEEALAELIGPEALLPPRWYLTVQPDDSSERPDLTQPALFDRLLDKPTMTDPGFLPFDWPTAIALLDSTEAMLFRLIARVQKAVAQGDQAAADQAEGMAQTLARLRVVASKIEARAEAGPFDEKECARLIGALAKLTNADWMSEKALAEGRKPLSVLQFQGYRSYRKVYEAQARRVYSAAPDTLPEATLKRLLPVWEEQAKREAIFIGNTSADHLPEDQPCLLLLPTSELAGWQIGDMSRWAVQISPEALAQGDWAAARAQNSHGQDWQ